MDTAVDTLKDTGSHVGVLVCNNSATITTVSIGNDIHSMVR